MSLCARSALQTARRPTTFSKPAFLYLKRQLATEAQPASSSLNPTPSSPSLPVSTNTAPDASPPGPANGRRKPKSRHPDGALRTLETMPYTAYQTALKYLREDRVEKLEQIAEERAKINAWTKHKGVTQDHPQIKKMQEYIDELLLNIDKNNPRIKYHYDLKKNLDPHRRIYQYWDDMKWRSMRRKLLMQRLEQMYVVPDVIPTIDPIVDVHISFRRHRIPLGSKVLSKDVRFHPSIKVTPFDSKERLVTVVVIDPDKPNFNKNGYDFYLQWMVTNCPVSITKQLAIGRGTRSEGKDEVVPYEPPYVHKGENYHRYCLFVFEQDGRIDVGKEGTKLKAVQLLPGNEIRVQRLGFNLRSFMFKHKLKPIGAHLWRCEYDNTTMQLMKNLGIESWNLKYVKDKEFI